MRATSPSGTISSPCSVTGMPAGANGAIARRVTGAFAQLTIARLSPRSRYVQSDPLFCEYDAEANPRSLEDSPAVTSHATCDASMYRIRNRTPSSSPENPHSCCGGSKSQYSHRGPPGQKFWPCTVTTASRPDIAKDGIVAPAFHSTPALMYCGAATSMLARTRTRSSAAPGPSVPRPTLTIAFFGRVDNGALLLPMKCRLPSFPNGGSVPPRR